MADLGVDCTVISPVPVNQYLATFSRLPRQTAEYTTSGAEVKLFYPRYVSFGQHRLGPVHMAGFTTHLFHQAVRNVWKNLTLKPEVVYGHFLTPAGICASRIGKEFQVAAFAAFGESTPWSIYKYGIKKIRKEIAGLNGIISVSTANRKTLEELSIFPADKIKVFPNGIQGKHFYPRDKQKARARFGFDNNKFLVAYLGQFTHRKGVLRVAEALEPLDNVAVAYAGRGELVPRNTNCIFKQSISPEEVPEFLSAADIFLLPTLNEGCSNAVIEAMSCGLPIVSSNLPFNEDILDTNNAILINPTSIGEIREAVTFLKDHPQVNSAMAQASIKMAKVLTIEARAQNIMHWIDEMR